MIKTVSSRDNPAVKLAAAVAGGDRKQGLMLLEGRKLLGEAIKMGMVPEYIFVDENVDYEKYLNYNIYQVSDSLLRRITDIKTPDGVCCLVKRPVIQSAESIAGGRYLAADGIQDPKNIGAIYRIADAFALDGVILIGANADPYSPKASRGSMGSNLRVKSYRADTGSLDVLKRSGMDIYAGISGSGAVDIREIRNRDCFAVVIGNEGSGIAPETLGAVTEKIKIPMPGSTESLNAAVAAGIIIWELTR